MISVLASCEKARSFFNQTKEKYTELASIVPKNQFYHYHDMWRFVNQRLTFLISLTLFLETGKLATINQVAEILGCKYIITFIGINRGIFAPKVQFSYIQNQKNCHIYQFWCIMKHIRMKSQCFKFIVLMLPK